MPSDKLPRSILEASPGSTRLQSLDRLGAPRVLLLLLLLPAVPLRKVQSLFAHTLAPSYFRTTFLTPCLSHLVSRTTVELCTSPALLTAVLGVLAR